MEDCWTNTISPDRSSLLPALLWLCTEGKGFGSSFLRGCIETVSCKKACGSRAVGVAGQGWGLLQETCYRVLTGSGDNVAARTLRPGAGAALSPKALVVPSPCGSWGKPWPGLPGIGSLFGIWLWEEKGPASQRLGWPAAPTRLSGTCWKCPCRK